MPSIANQDFKIYGLLSDTDPIIGIEGSYCGELYSAYKRANTLNGSASVIDGFVFSSSKDYIIRQNSLGEWYDSERGEWLTIVPTHENPAYYDALWAIQEAVYAHTGDILAGDTEFGINQDGKFAEAGYGDTFVNEDGYIIKGTAADGKLASLYLGEKAESMEDFSVVRLESLLPLVGELPLDTIEIW